MHSSSDIELIEQLADEFAQRQQQGEKPSIEEYVQRYPNLAGEIQEVFPALVMMEQIAPATDDLKEPEMKNERHLPLDRVGDYRIIREVGRGGMGVVYEAEQESLRRRVALKVLPKQNAGDPNSVARFQREARAAARMHHTNIVPVFEVGQAEDSIFYAMQLIHGQGLERVIEDLKRIRAESSHSKSGFTKLDAVRESAPASIAASLIAGRFESENLVNEDVADAGGGDLFHPLPTDTDALLADAETIAEELHSTASVVLPGQSEISSAETNRSGYFHSVAQIGLQTAHALAYAHSRGIIHRDIKPSNLLLDATGTVWVTDFGLAKTNDEEMTHTGDILGTIRYMSPERFRGQCDARADVYSLGLTLYEMLMLKPAFVSADRLRLIEMATKSEPESPRTVDPKIPRDLETIVLKSVDKDPKRRYQSADEMAEDLQRFIDDEPIKARRISFLERYVRWARRNKMIASLGAAVTALLVAGVIASSLAATHFRELASDARLKKEEAELAKRAAVDQREKTRHNLYYANMIMAGNAARDDSGLSRVAELIKRWIPNSDHPEDYRGWEWYYLQSLLLEAEQTFTNARGCVTGGGFRLVTAGKDGSVSIRDTDSGEVVSSLPAGSINPSAIRRLDRSGHRLAILDPSGHRLAIAVDDTLIEVWDLRLGQVSTRITTNGQEEVRRIYWSPAGDRIAVGHGDYYGKGNQVKLWDAITGEPTVSINPTAPVHRVAWSPDGSEVAIADTQNYLRFWDTSTGAVIGQDGYLFDSTELQRAMAWSPDGTRIAMAGLKDYPILIIDTKTGKELHKLLGHSSPVEALAWTADGKFLASGSWDKTIRIWDTETQEIKGILRGHRGNVIQVAWDEAGSRLISTDTQKTVKVWHVDYNTMPKNTRGATSLMKDDVDEARCFMNWSPKGDRFTTTDGERAFVVWDTITRKPLQRIFPQLSDETDLPAFMLRQVSWSPDATELAFPGRNAIDIFNVETGERVRQIPIPVNSEFYGHAWDPDGSRVIVWDAEAIHVLDSQTGDELVSKHFRDTQFVVWHPDPESHCLAFQDRRTIRVWNYQTGEVSESVSFARARVIPLAWNPEGSKLAAGVGGDQLKVWDWDGTQLSGPRLFAGHSRLIFTLSWSPDGKRIATGSQDGTAKIWDPETGQETFSLFGHDSGTFVFWHPDGKRILTTQDYFNGSSKFLWDASKGYAAEQQ